MGPFAFFTSLLSSIRFGFAPQSGISCIKQASYAPAKEQHCVTAVPPFSVQLQSLPSKLPSQAVALSNEAHPKMQPVRTILRCESRQRRGIQPVRVVISGRMADVCAELDRLVALESRPA
jgi:hypothetical protein